MHYVDGFGPDLCILKQYAHAATVHRKVCLQARGFGEMQNSRRQTCTQLRTLNFLEDANHELQNKSLTCLTRVARLNPSGLQPASGP